MQANQLRLWLSSLAYVLLCAVRRIGLAGTRLENATCGTIRLQLLKIGALGHGERAARESGLRLLLPDRRRFRSRPATIMRRRLMRQIAPTDQQQRISAVPPHPARPAAAMPCVHGWPGASDGRS